MTNPTSLHRRLGRLEAMQPENDHGMPFLWFKTQALDEALVAAKLSLDDGPVFPIRLLGDGIYWPISEHDQARLNEAEMRPDRHPRGLVGRAEPVQGAATPEEQCNQGTPP